MNQKMIFTELKFSIYGMNDYMNPLNFLSFNQLGNFNVMVAKMCIKSIKKVIVIDKIFIVFHCSTNFK